MERDRLGKVKKMIDIKEPQTMSHITNNKKKKEIMLSKIF
jgi:hypothetical protein